MRPAVPPPPLPRRVAPRVRDEAEITKPLGIAARIAGLQLNQVGRSPIPGKPAVPERKAPITPEDESPGEQEVVPPPPSYQRRSSVPQPVPKSAYPSWEEIEARGDDFVRAISRKPPPIPSAKTSAVPPPPASSRRLPPVPVRLPTPPPEPEPEHEEHEEPQGCILCHDFSFVDNHAGQFPRETVTSLDQLAYDLTSPWESETEKFRAIFTWLHHNIAYDADAFFCGSIQAATPESTLHSGLAVCDGYASLFNSLAEQAGLQAIKVTGHGKGFGYVSIEPGGPVPPYEPNHAWNCALMDGEWRLVDSCWGAGAVDSSGFQKRFTPTWFTFTNAQFGKRHYPDDSAYQLISEEEGGPVSWEDYILEERPLIFSSFYENNFAQQYLQPVTKYIQSGTWVTFHLFKFCEHLSTADADNYVSLIQLPDQTNVPLILNAESGGWSANVYVPAGPGEISLLYVKQVNGKDAKGLGVKGFNASIGRIAMYFEGLCRWNCL